MRARWLIALVLAACASRAATDVRYGQAQYLVRTWEEAIPQCAMLPPELSAHRLDGHLRVAHDQDMICTELLCARSRCCNRCRFTLAYYGADGSQASIGYVLGARGTPWMGPDVLDCELGVWVDALSRTAVYGTRVTDVVQIEALCRP